MVRSNRLSIRLLACSAAALAALWMFYSVGADNTLDHQLVFGSLGLSTPPTGLIFSLWLVFGLILTAALIPIAQLFLRRWPVDESVLTPKVESQLVLLSTLLAFLVPSLLRIFVMHDAPITDDESAYYFASQLLSHGHLTAPSHLFKLFYDRAFLVNDGRMYVQYFLGWPALMLPGTILGRPDLMNPLYSALTVPPLYWLLRRSVGPWALVGIVLFLASPFIQLSAATMLSHTACMMALAWGLWFCVRGSDHDASPLHGAAVALAFSVAFFIRPLTAVGFGAWPVGWWLLQQLRNGQPGRRRLLSLGAFGVVGAAMAAAFLWVNFSQTGSPFRSAYQAAYAYAKSNHFRFSAWAGPIPRAIPNLDFRMAPFYRTGVALYRLLIAAQGWPITGALLVLAAFQRQARLYLGAAIGLCALLTLSADPGVDLIGPVHYTELTLLVIILVTIALYGISQWEARALVANLPKPHLAGSLLCASLVAGLLLYVPVRVRSIAHVTEPISEALHIPDHQGKRLVVFSGRPFIPLCATWPSGHFVFWRPLNDPQLENRVIWVNHLTVDLDRQLMQARFPDRDGYIQLWAKPCRRLVVPLTAGRDVLKTLPDTQLSPGQDLSDVRRELAAALKSDGAD